MQHSSASDGIFHAIADPNRRRLIDLLAEGEKSVQELAQGFDITMAAISQHLAVLLDSHLVTRRAQGRQRLYRLDAAPLRIVDEWTSQHRRFWQSRLKSLHAYLDKAR
jgi:DNA-binding transcriptional ArsR family regulator